jgi:glutathione S-transferase
MTDVATSWVASVARLGLGMRVSQQHRVSGQPEKPIELYEFEDCPYCRRLREALSILDLDAMIYSCPRGGTRFRPRVKERGGKRQFPYMVDPNTGVEMYESLDIARYLSSTYGDGWVPLGVGATAVPLGSFASVMRLGKGRAVPSREPEQALMLYNFEASPYCRIAREALCQLELPYLQRNVAKGSPKRKAFVERSGRMMVPYLVDPNTGIEMFESADIAAYLFDTYAL